MEGTTVEVTTQRSMRPSGSGGGETMAKVKVETRKPIRMAYIEHVGDYGAIPFAQYIER